MRKFSYIPLLLYYTGIFIVNGKVVYEMNTAGNARYTVTSLRTYDDGQWYQVTFLFQFYDKIII